MKNGLYLVILILLSGFIQANAETKYAISEIPAALLKDAKAVIRKNDIAFEISARNRAVEKVTYAITILNKNGLELSVFAEGYNKFLSVRKIKASVYDRSGKEIRTGDNTEVKDIAAVDGYDLYNDYRVKFINPAYSVIPFTVEYTYEIDFDGLLNYPVWTIYPDYNVALEKSNFTVTVPQGFLLRYLEQNVEKGGVFQSIDGKTIYRWTAEGLPALHKELFSPQLDELTPAVYTAPDDFEIGGVEGNCGSWSSFGCWIKQLNKDRNLVSPETSALVRSMISRAGNDIDKVRILYKFLQNRVRYVSIQEGLGGWQPIDAATVDMVSYGDCKALANYMKALLDIAGLKSYYTIIRAGEETSPLRETFPSNQFNHAIICVPVQQDTLWLECTDQNIPFGFLGTFTDDRKALLIGDSGGTVVRTRSYSLEENSRARWINVSMDEHGTALASVHTRYGGLKYDEVSRALVMDDEDRKRFIHDRIGLPGCNLLSFRYYASKTEVPYIDEDLSISVPGYITAVAGENILKPDIMSRSGNISIQTVRRITPIIVKRPSCEVDTVIYDLHGLYKPGNLPGKVTIMSPFGEYSAELLVEGTRLTYVRSLKLFKGIFTSDQYDSYVDFHDRISAEDNRQLVLGNL